MAAVFFWPLAGAVALVVGLFFLYIRALKQPGRSPRPCTEAELARQAGFQLRSLPKSELLVRGRLLLREGRTAEVEFTLSPGHSLVLWVSPAKKPPADSRLPGGFDQQACFYCRGVKVTLLHSPGGRALALWQREGFAFALFAEEGEMGLPGGILEAFVRHCDAAPA